MKWHRKWTLAVVLVLAALVALPGCVSQALAEKNLESVRALGEVVVAIDEGHQPLATAAEETAVEIVDASDFWTQVAAFGFPEELIEENSRNVAGLTAAFDAGKVVIAPADAAKGEVVKAAAVANVAKLEGKSAKSNALGGAAKTAAGGIPWGTLAVTAVGAIAATIAGASAKKKLGKKKEPPPAA